MITTGKFFLQRSETGTLYILTFHSTLHQFLINGPNPQNAYKDTFQSQCCWAEEIANDSHILAQLQTEHYLTPAQYH